MTPPAIVALDERAAETGARRKRTLAVLVGSALALVLALVLAVSIGTDPVSVWTALTDGASRDHDIVFDVRLPRVLLAAVAGAGLSVVGVALQSLLRNPLAEPFVLGVSGGSALGATVAILFGITSTTLLGASLVPLAALIGGLGATLLVFTFASVARESYGTSVLLAGIVVNAIAGAAITFIKTFVTPQTAQDLLRWLMGFLEVPSLASLTVLSIYTALGCALLFYDAARLNVLSLGDEAAAHLGIRVRAVEIRTVLASSLIVGAIVSATGLIGFVGLIVPHVLRRLLGSDTRLLMPASLALGGAALVLCDLVSRGAFRWVHRELPVGAITALIGGPLFLFVLLRRRSP